MWILNEQQDMGGGGGELQRAAGEGEGSYREQGEGKGATGICLVLRGKEKDCLITIAGNLWQSYSRCGYLAQNPWKQQ